ncbi:hypothetical protein B0H15DRAFT_953228 [Mycena belliarum]|uniref:Uncharacterized protein n=1 Tax=Mycena belliarum TaxID=1033014 RepID=A0AAD6XMC4_9AGAR|nr:hypothetical protein B0H15DRAFT_953228 [Mycena belliae]
MHFPRPLLALVLLAAPAARAAPSPGPSSSLTKRWCGFDRSCPCMFDPKLGCALQYDACGKHWYWPAQCTGCAPCLELCVDFLCEPPTA